MKPRRRELGWKMLMSEETYVLRVVEFLAQFDPITNSKGENCRQKSIDHAWLAVGHNAHDIARCYVENMSPADCAQMLCTTPPDFCVEPN